MPAVIGILEGHLAKIMDAWRRLLTGRLRYGPVLNALEKARFSYADFPRVQTYIDAFRSRPSWQATPRLPVL